MRVREMSWTDLVGTEPTRRLPSDPLPAWPLLTMLWGFPLMWVLGLTVVPGAVTMAVVMLGFMLVRRYALWVPGVGALVGLCLWMAASAVMIDTGPRMLGFGFRLAIMSFVAIAFVYTVAARTRLTRRRLVHGLTFLWFFVIVGGVLGMLLPGTRLTTPVGMLLPASISGNSYVRDLFFPPFAEVQHPWGAPEPFVRPSAPFPYANSWGVAILVLTPIALACFMMTRSWLLRCAIIVGAGVMIFPAMATSNRGMFAALALAGAYVLVRYALRDRAAPVITLTLLGLAAGGVLVWQGLFTQFEVRQEYGQSNGARFTLYAETIQRTLASPLLGYGAPRPSAEQALSVGTQGYIWTLMFSFGFVGLALFLAFLWGSTWRTRYCRDDVDVALHATLVVSSLAIIVYGLDIIQLLAIALVAAILLRRRYGLDDDD
ncbi:O-antigen ligase family protein [Aeromicrobium sp. 50.2.37]|uniref:O-antigen ligase family protein n=1 Tax=Aeromicrobium sp. 50.2.37 TaxID=2969305 RepID=UPI0035B0A346